jgi:molybdopterin adenylyltransferase
LTRIETRYGLGAAPGPGEAGRVVLAAALEPELASAIVSDIPIGVVTISDRASQGVYEDKGAPGIEAALKDLVASPWRPVRRLVPDERPAIEAALIALADSERCSLILTTGGTGPAPRDVTPEATEAVCERLLPGFGELMRAKSLAEAPTAILSRQIAGTRGKSLIINLPGKPAAIRTCLDAVFRAVPYCIDLIGGDRLETNPEFCKAFRPKA